MATSGGQDARPQAKHCGVPQGSWKLREKRPYRRNCHLPHQTSVAPKRCPLVATPWASRRSPDRGRGGSLVSAVGRRLHRAQGIDVIVVDRCLDLDWHTMV
jgi:hypothetical protein